MVEKLVVKVCIKQDIVILGDNPTQTGYHKFALANVALNSNQPGLCRTADIVKVFPVINK